MTPRETKFILRAHRADGRYADDDPAFAEALRQAHAEPELAAWLEREHRLDEVVAQNVDAIQPPAGLRETILAGGRASRLSRPAWRQPRWLAFAAGIAVVLTLSMVYVARPGPSLNAGSFAHLAIAEHAGHPHGHDDSAALRAIAASLGTRTTPLTAGLSLSAEEMRAAQCTNLRLGDRDVYEVCFERDGVWFHLYVTPLDHAGRPQDDRRPVFLQQDQLAAAAWTDGMHLFSLVTSAGAEALARVV